MNSPLDNFTNIIVLIISILATIISILVFLRRGKVRFGKIFLDFGSNVDQETEKILQQLTSKDTSTNLDDKKYALLRQYHSQGLAQSKISFWFSLIFASIGFVIIVIGILTFQKESSLYKPVISIISGTIIDAVAALFFVQSNKARELMTEFFDKLRADRKFEEALTLADQIPDNHLKSKLKILLSMNFADIKTSDAILTLILDGIERNSAKPNITET